MKKILSAFMCLMFTNSTSAQMAAASLFSDMKAVNPAVIGTRKKGHYTLIGNKDSYEKVQEISEIEEAKLNSEIVGFSFFRGGKMGGLITTESSVILESGDRDIKFRGGDTDFDFDSEISYTQFRIGLGISQFLGIQIAKQNFKLDQSFSFDNGGTLVKSVETINRESLGLRAGAILPLGPLRVSAYYEIVDVEQKVESTRPALPSSETSPMNRFLGIGLGIVTENLHIELGLERFLNPEKGLQGPEEDPGPEARDRISGTFEVKVYGVSLGYTGRFYQDGYQDQDQTVVNQLIYGNSLDDRMEHNLNFSFTPPQGLSLGGSLIYSKSTGDERSPIDPSSIDAKYPTQSKQLGIMGKLGYVW